MSYQVLARKWRPQSFNDLVGQVHVLKALINALDTGRLHHAYLFTGTRGVGKTTIARILAKCLNCEQGVSSTPCGTCASCVEITEGRFVDLIEVDAASRTRVEDTRELLENVNYAPTRGRFKVYLIDEVHMLSQHSFNALLKTLEEPPPHVKFLLATTDPQKLPVTVLSRCLQFSLKNMAVEHIFSHLKNILESEKISFEEAALWLLARAAEGSMRDALSLTEQAVSYCGGSITAENTGIMLGSIDRNKVLELIDTLISNNAKQVLACVNQISEHAPDYASVLNELLVTFHQIAIAQMIPGGIDPQQPHAENIAELATQMTAEDVQLYYQSGLIGKKDLALAPDARTGFEMILLRMLAFRPGGVPEKPDKPLPQNNREIASLTQVSDDEPPPDDMVESSLQPEDLVKKKITNKETNASGSVISENQPAYINEEEGRPFDLEQKITQVQVSVDLPGSLEQCAPGSWITLQEKLPLAGVAKTLALNCTVEKSDATSISLVLDKAHDTLYNKMNHQRIEKALTEFFSSRVELRIRSDNICVETPAIFYARQKKQRLIQAQEYIYADENVQRLIKEFGAQVDENSIVPLEENKEASADR